MADKSIQEKRRRRQKAVKDPVCASRVIKNQFYGTGWSGKLSTEEKHLATSLLDDAGAMYSLQITRDREVTPLSLHNAIFWEHHQLSDQTIVSTPALIWEQQEQLNEQTISTGLVHAIPFFTDDKDWKESFEKVAKKTSSSSTVEIHHFFSNIRDREFTVWPITVEGFWMTIIMRVVEIKTPVIKKGKSSNHYFDRKVSQFAIIDPISDEDADDRLELVFTRLQTVLRQGCILLTGDTMVDTLKTDQVGEEWESGYLAFAISREFLRRLKVLIHRRKCGESGGIDSDKERELLWTPFEEIPTVDGYREALMSACSNYVIETSGYRIRSALEVPSAAADFEPEKLQPERYVEPEEEVEDEKIIIGDQTRRFNLEMDLSTSQVREASVEVEDLGELLDNASGSEESEEDEDDDDHDDHASDASKNGDKNDRNTVVVKKEPEDEDGSSQEVPIALNIPKSTEPETKDRASRAGTPFSQNDPAEDLRESLKSIASAAQNLAKDVQASKNMEEDVIQSDVAPPPEGPDTPPTQQEVDSGDEDAVANMLYAENVTTHPAPVGHPLPELPLPESEMTKNPEIKEEKHESPVDLPEAQQQMQSQEPGSKVPEAKMEEQQVQSREVDNVPGSATKDIDQAKKNIIVDEDDYDIEEEEPVTTKASIEGVESLSAINTTVIPTIEMEAESTALPLRKEGENTKEDDSIFGDGETPTSRIVDEDDMYTAEKGVGQIEGPTESIGDYISEGSSSPRRSATPAPSTSLPPPPPPPPSAVSPDPTSIPTPARTPTPTPIPSYETVNNTVIPGLSVTANAFPSSLGKRKREEEEEEEGTGESEGEGNGQGRSGDAAEREWTDEPPEKRRKGDDDRYQV